jgi:hypothetical protein
MDEKYSSIKGIYRDILKDGNNTVIFDSGWVSNVIVDQCRALLAALMKNNTPGGIRCLKVGKGDPNWDTLAEGPPPPNESETALVDEEPYAIDVGDHLVLHYLHGSGAVVDYPTNRLEITATLGANVPPPPEPHVSTYPLREFGLFGVYVEVDKNDPEVRHEYEYMIDCIRHPVIHKDETATLIRTVRLYF